MDYKSAGVDVARGDQLVDWLKSGQESPGPHADKLVSGIGGFASLFRFQFPQMKAPLIVSSTDGVGTKVKLASEFGRLSGIGQDLVAMCVNDLICCGAEPLFFLDYYATGQLQLADAQAFLNGVRDACFASGCALIGGETAEMPGVYQHKDFDCAGFAVGVVDEPELLGAHRVQAGDIALGLASSGFHSNGYSLLRKVFAADTGDWLDELMKPTTLYPALVNKIRAQAKVKAIAHITGGGLENLPRVLPEKTTVQLQPWQWPEPFFEVMRRTGLTREQMLKTLNCGVGLVLIVAPEEASRVQAVLQAEKMTHYNLGVVEPSTETEPSVRYEDA